MSDSTKAVFLSYASQDAEAARRICEALRAAGVEVWFDQSELVGGDAWDQKIRKQIKDCALLIPIISANTQSRTEGYFRLEWRLADQRTHLMGRNKAFLLPVAIDGTTDADADVPDSFAAVQWTKAPGGEVPPAFVARVQKLLGGSNVGASLDDAGGSVAPDGRRQAAPLQKSGDGPSKWWWALPMFGVAMALALVMKEQRKEPAPTAPTPAPPATAPQSEARQLVAKAWVQLNKTELGRSELETAEELCKQALARDPNDADALAASSQVDAWFVYFGLQDTPERREGARAKAIRAMQIDPTGYEPRLAQAAYLTRAWGNRGVSDGAPEAEQRLRELLRERPAEPRALLTLALLQRNTGRLPESYVTFRQLTGNPAFAALAWNELGWAQYIGRDFVPAEAAADRSIALQPYWGNLSLKLWCGLLARGDLDQAKRILEQMAPAALQEDYGAALANYVYYLRREPAAGLRVLNNVPRDWLSAGGRSGPRAGFAGILHEMAGHAAAARTEFTAALKVVEQRLAEKPSSLELLRWKARLLVHLGRRPEAEGIFHSVWEMEGSEQALDLILLDRPDETIAVLERQDSRGTATPLALLRLDPGYDPLRKNPRFIALLAKLEAEARSGPRVESLSRTPVAPVSPARQLAEKAMALSIANESSSTGLLAAADVAEKATQLDSTDGDVWAIAAMVDIRCWVHAADRTDRRVEMARMKVIRAKGLAPRSVQVRFAEARLLTELDLGSEGYSRAEAILRELKKEELDPGLTIEFTGVLGIAVGKQGRGPESALLFEEAGRAGPGWMHAASWAYLAAWMLPEALRAAQQEAAGDGIKGLLQQVTVQLVRGDLDAANALLEQIPAAERSDELPASAVASIAYLRREPERMLAAVKSIPGDFQSSGFLYGPKAEGLAWAHLLAGHQEAAKVNWRAALAAVDERIAAHGSDQSLLRLRLNYLAKLDRPDEAVQVYRLLQELRGDGVYLQQAADLAVLGRKEESLAALTEALRRKSNMFCFAFARYDPIFDLLRGDPRFEKLLRETLPPGSKPFDDAQGRPFDDPKPSSSAQATADKEVKR